MRTFEINGHEGFLACSSLQKLSHDRDSMQTAHKTLRQNQLNGVEPYVYLKATLEAIATGHLSARSDELML
jgi:hypothetical protein